MSGFSLRSAAKDAVATAKNENLQELDQPDEPAARPVIVEEPRLPRPKAKKKKQPKYERVSTRIGARGVTTWVDEDLFRRIKIAALDDHLTTQDLMLVAIVDFLDRRDRRQK